MIDTVKIAEQQSDTALSFWELFNTRITTKELRITEIEQNNSTMQSGQIVL